MRVIILSKLSVFLLSIGLGYSQVNTNGTGSASITAENPFFDASSNFDLSVDPTSSGKGLLFPRTDLTTFTFKTDLLDGIIFPTAFDGMIVYNIGTGSTLTGQGIVTSVTPGFYYFSNPTGSTDVTSGTWKPLGGGTSGLVLKGSQVTNGMDDTYTISNSNITSNSIVTVSYYNTFNEIISHAITAITAGSFTVQFAAAPANGGSILYTILN